MYEIDDKTLLDANNSQTEGKRPYMRKTDRRQDRLLILVHEISVCVEPSNFFLMTPG